ncbi:MAG: Phosphoglycolate phosphatase [candidate division BRC1 bacterium ADurb.BinA364]|nr:MAG: Phosphoglycolate phosphatase [candidate division BRC1 bacterium ADurb.BinA364]
MPPANQAAANAALLEIEIEAARRCELMPNAAETLGILRGAGLKMALLTRNAPEAKAIAMAKYPCLRFDLAWSREMGPLKPEPDGVLRACAALEIDPALTVCVGDYRYDLEAARAAGAISVWLGRPDRPDFSEMADFTIRDLAELPRLLGLNGDRPAPGEIRRSHS